MYPWCHLEVGPVPKVKTGLRGIENEWNLIFYPRTTDMV